MSVADDGHDGDGHDERWFPDPITRRRLLERALIAGGALSAGTGLLAGCMGGDDDEESAGTTQTAGQTGAGKPKRGGTIVLGAQTPGRGFDPVKWWDPNMYTGAYALYDRLFAFKPDGTGIEPDLLVAMPELTRDGTLYSFELRPGVKFHHGRELTADDVKFSIERLVRPSSAGEPVSLYSGLPIVGMKELLDEKAKALTGIKVDGKKFTIELERPESALTYLFTHLFSSIVPRDVVEDIGDKKFNFAPVGTGPFMAKNVNARKGATLERNPDYWKPGIPHVDRVRWDFGVDASLSVLRIKRGEQDLMFEEVPAAAIAELRNDPEFKDQLHIEPTNNVYYVTMPFKHPAIKKRAVREAIARAIDKQRLVRTLKGLAEPGTAGVFGPGTPYHVEGLAHPHDPEGAKRLLTEAGYPTGFDVDIIAINTTPFAQMAQTVQQDLKTVGINAKIRSLDISAFSSEVTTNPPPPAIMTTYYSLPYPHGSYIIDGGFTTAALKAGCCNQANFTDPKVEKLISEAHGVSDEDELVRRYKELDRIIVHDEIVWIPLIYIAYADFVSKRVRGFQIAKVPNPATKIFANYWLETA
jgi:ABC-type transport system substrate-binding protein